MDILCRPENPTRPVEKTPYHCDPTERWDGGPFITYPQRRGFLHLVPPRLRDYDPDTPFTEDNYPTDLKLRQGILTTWLFFGLASEVFGANRQDNPDRPPDNPTADNFINSLYQSCIIKDQDGQNNITGRPLLELSHLVPTYIRASSNVKERLQYLRNCFNIADQMINMNSTAANGIGHSLRFGLAAVGEFLAHAVIDPDPGTVDGIYHVSMPERTFSLGWMYWKSDFLAEDGPIWEQMLNAGWCKSDLNRADDMYYSLFTAHCLSLLDRNVPGRNHSACTESICKAAQIDNDSYKLSHVAQDCSCSEFFVDVDSIKGILLSTSTYPILVFDPDDETSLRVKQWEVGDEYVAISHVWADGLGNTQDNALQKCQVTKLRHLVYAVEEAVWRKETSNPRPKYHLWIDTLCCPVARLEPHCNNIALMRMKAVYSHAAHVLVLDLALSLHDAEGLSPSTLLLRIFASSIWMRRLWTLQEGALAKSLYFQFRDKPVHAQSVLEALFYQEDLRYRIIWSDIESEFGRFKLSSLASTRAGKHPLFRTIRDALDFRSASCPSDEPICIATLLGLDLYQILKDDDETDAEESRTEKRMCNLWRLLARADGGIPARLPFVVEAPLKTPGFGWAPNSLLRSNKKLGLEAPMHIPGRKDKFVPSGFITEYGLAVDFPGWMLKPKPLCEDLPLHIWDGLQSAYYVSQQKSRFFYDEQNDAWFRMRDWHEIWAPPTAVKRSLTGSDDDDPKPSVCGLVDTGRVALIRGEDIPTDHSVLLILAEILEENAVPLDAQKPGYRVRWLRRFMVSRVCGPELLILKTFRNIALEVASSPEARDLVEARQRFGEESAIFDVEKHKVREKFRLLTNEALDTVDGFARAAEQTVSPDINMKEVLWMRAPRMFAHDIEGIAMADDQRWYID